MSDDSNTRPNPFRTAPNLLTLLRICMAPFLVAAILESHYLLGFVLFVAAGLTDALDGTLARVLKQRSMLGHYLDPVADKLLLSTLFLVLMHTRLIPVTVTVMVLVHERVSKQTPFDEEGYRGVLLPVPGHGSIAVLAKDQSGPLASVEAIAARVRSAIEWTG